MVVTWVKDLIFGKASYGVELVFRANEEFDYAIIETGLIKNKLEIVNREKGKSLDSLLNYKWKKDLPVFLTVRGKGVLQRRVSFQEGQSEQELVRKALPNAKVDDFYHHIEEINESYKWVVLVRKSVLNPFLEKAKNAKLHVSGIELGFLSISKLSAVLETDSFSVDSQRIQLSKGVLMDVEDSFGSKNDSVKVGEEQLDSSYLSALGTALNFYGFKYDGLETSFVLNGKEEFKHHMIFKFGVKFILGFLLLLLLTNFFIFQHYNKEYSNLSEKLSLNSALIDKLESLKTEYKRNQLFFENTDLISSSKSAFFADRLAKSKIKGIYWNQLSLNPPVKKIKKSEDIAFDIGKINVSGITESSEILNQWIEVLKEKDWVQSIDIKDYQQLENKKEGSFFIQILLK